MNISPITSLTLGIDQVTKYINHLSSFPKLGSQSIQNYSIVGGMITNKFLPIPIPQENLIAII